MGEDEDALPEQVALINERSPELYALAKRHPGVPVFNGALIEWPDWWWKDEATLRQFERHALLEKRREKRRKAWRENERKRMKARR